jgi:tetrahydromethanopterin S-methyltransferase subunit F
VVGGSLLGAFIAVFAIIWSSNRAMKKLGQATHKKLLKRYRNETIAWVIAWASIITAGYEFTSGWMGPVFTYLGFAIGVVLLMVRTMNLIHTHAANAAGKKASNVVIVVNYLCLSAGMAAGFSGLLIGLIASGRLVF